MLERWLVGFSLLIAAPAQAVPITWVDWTSADASSVYGSALVDGSTVTVTYTGERGFVNTTCGANFWAAPAGTFTSAVVDNAPDWDPDPSVRCDIIALNLATPKTLTFSDAVTNPLFAVVSLNGNGYRFDRDFAIISTGPGYYGNGTLAKQITTHPDGSTTYDLIGTGEPHGVIRFIGSFSTVSWTSLSNEYWNGFTIGFEHLAVTVPPEIAVHAHGVPIIDGQTTPVLVGSADVDTSTSVDISIVNSGTGPLNIDAITISGPDAAAFEVGPHILGLAAGSTTTVSLTFTASTAPTTTASVTIENSDADEASFTFPIIGIARIDTDGDGVIDADDNCPDETNLDQTDRDMDGLGDVCDDDADGDGVDVSLDCDDLDPMVSVVATFYADDEMDGYGDAEDSIMVCSIEPPGGYVVDGTDNCPAIANMDQANLDNDRRGDACDDDVDGDGALTAMDCDDRDPTIQDLTTFYEDVDDDGFGDPSAPRAFCALDPPTGYALTVPDNCVDIANDDQADADSDGIGDACDTAEPDPDPDPDPNPDPKDTPEDDGCSCGAARRGDGDPGLGVLLLTLGLLMRRRKSSPLDAGGTSSIRGAG